MAEKCSFSKNVEGGNAAIECQVFRALQCGDVVFIPKAVSPQRVEEQYITSLIGKKRREASRIRIPRNRREMPENGIPKPAEWDDAAAVFGGSAITDGYSGAEEACLLLKYDDRAFYMLGRSSESSRHRLSFFAKLKYTETFDEENFTLSPWRPLVGLGARSNQWINRNGKAGGYYLEEARINGYDRFGVEPPGVNTVWDANFEQSPAKDRQARVTWSPADSKRGRSFGYVTFGDKDDLYFRMTGAPQYAGGQVKYHAEICNSSSREQRFEAFLECYSSGILIDFQSVKAEVPAHKNYKLELTAAASSEDVLIVPVFSDEQGKIFYQETRKLKESK